VRWPRAVGDEGGELGRVDQPVLPGREDVAKAAPVVGPVAGDLLAAGERQDAAAELGK